MKSNKIEQRIEFAGLTRHNQQQMTDRAASVVGMDADNPPETSFATAVRGLKTAQSTTPAWKVPSNVAKRLSNEALTRFNAETPEGMTAYQAHKPGDDHPSVFVETDRFQALYSPEVLKDWLKGEFTETVPETNAERYTDALWQIPTESTTATNPLPIYEPFEQAVRDEELGDSMFGEIRTRKRGGEVHMDILFDRYTLEFGSDADGDDPAGGPIVLGIRTGYDFLGNRTIYAEGFAQDTACDNSIRRVTERKTRKSVGTAIDDVRGWWEQILTKMDLMTDRLAESIEVANGITVDLLEIGFAEPFEHNDDLVALYELAGFPAYLAESAASEVESRADDPFEPTMWDLNSGATYALTHDYTGGENTSRMNELSTIANDMVLNPAETASRVERTHREAVTSEADASEQGTLEDESVHAKVEGFAQTLEEQREEFETRQERMRATILADGGEDQ